MCLCTATVSEGSAPLSQVRLYTCTAVLGALTLLTVGLGITDPAGTPTYPTKFLVWNLFLAWIPMAAALLMTKLHQRLAVVGVGLVWLAFLPNAPYLVTDLVHLVGWDTALWRHVFQMGFATWIGIMLGVLSLRVVHIEVTRRANAALGWGAVAASVVLCAAGLVIGRFQRWNSWDLVSNPKSVAATTYSWVSSPIANVRSTGVAVIVAAFFGLAYLTICCIDGMGQQDSVPAKKFASSDGDAFSGERRVEGSDR